MFKLKSICFTLLLVFNSFAVLSNITNNAKSFSPVISDSLIIGEKYDIKLKDGLIISGVVISKDSITVTVESRGDKYKIARSQIKNINAFEEIFPELETAKPSGKLSTKECEIYLNNRALYKDVTITQLIDSTLKIEKEGIKNKINVFEINKIRFKTGVGFWGGAAIGAGVSIVSWVLLSAALGGGEYIGYGFIYGLVSSVPAALVGGLIGLLTEGQVLYDFSKSNPKARLKKMNYIINKHMEKKQ